MQPETYARLYGPWRPSRPERGYSAMALAAFAVWMPTLVSVAWMTLVVGLGVLLGVVDGLSYVAYLAAGVAVLASLALIPPLRRLALPARMLVLGVLALPVPVGVAMWTAVMLG